MNKDQILAAFRALLLEARHANVVSLRECGIGLVDVVVLVRAEAAIEALKELAND